MKLVLGDFASLRDVRPKCADNVSKPPEEVEVAAPCFLSLDARRILIVTSPYHTRRALAIFRHRLPQYDWSVTAAPDETAYGTDRWRYGPVAR